MSFQSLIAHNGVSHQKSTPAKKTILSPTEAQDDELKNNSTDSPTVVPKSNSTLEQKIVETPENKVEKEAKAELVTTTETPVTSDLTTATLVPGFGESIFGLVIATPFLLFGFKKWLHR